MNGISTCYISNVVDENGNPTGGSVSGVGLQINWQVGPLNVGAFGPFPRGAFVETVISAVVQRLEFYQAAADGKFACSENLSAIDHLNRALEYLEQRRLNREHRGVEGTHEA